MLDPKELQLTDFLLLGTSTEPLYFTSVEHRRLVGNKAGWHVFVHKLELGKSIRHKLPRVVHAQMGLAVIFG